MMRLAGRAVGGFFPCPPEAVALIADLLHSPEVVFCLVDPCAGKGAAVKQLAEALRCKPENVFAIALDGSRAVEFKVALPNGRVLAPASFLGVAATVNSFGLAYVNAPFDSEFGHNGRVEYTFLQRATSWLRPGGVIALVCPEHVAERYDVTQYLCQWFADLALLPFPASCREYEEVVVFGHKRPKPVDAAKLSWPEVCQRDIQPGHYSVPPGHPPKRFEQVELTEPELARALLCSPLRKRLQPPR